MLLRTIVTVAVVAFMAVPALGKGKPAHAGGPPAHAGGPNKPDNGGQQPQSPPAPSQPSLPAVVSSADFVSLAFSGSISDYIGTVTYSTAGLLTFDLTNTSDPSNGGFMTAFAFNLAGSPDISLSLDSYTGFSSLHFKTNVGAPPFGTFDFGVSTGNGNGNSFINGGGSPSKGLGVGKTGSIVFTVSGADVGLLSASDFVSEASPNGSKQAILLGRFRGFNDGRSNKTPGGTTVNAVPTPTAGLAGLGLMSLLAMRRRSRLN